MEKTPSMNHWREARLTGFFTLAYIARKANRLSNFTKCLYLTQKKTRQIFILGSNNLQDLKMKSLLKCRAFSLWLPLWFSVSATKKSQEWVKGLWLTTKGLRTLKCGYIHHRQRKMLNRGTSLLKIRHYLLKTGTQYPLMRSSKLCRTSIKL